MGSEMIAYGNECDVVRSNRIQDNEPMKQDRHPMIKYILVDLDRSNLLRYDSNKPGNINTVMGNHAHFLYISLVMDGNNRNSGL